MTFLLPKLILTKIQADMKITIGTIETIITTPILIGGNQESGDTVDLDKHRQQGDI